MSLTEDPIATLNTRVFLPTLLSLRSCLHQLNKVRVPLPSCKVQLHRCCGEPMTLESANAEADDSDDTQALSTLSESLEARTGR